LSKSISDIEILSQHLVPVVPDHTTLSRRALMWRPSASCNDKEVLNRMLACARPKSVRCKTKAKWSAPSKT